MTSPRGVRDRVLHAIRVHRLWVPGERVGVAVSGGVDSVVLLDILARTNGIHRGALHILSVDHGQSRVSSQGLEVVAALAEERGLPCTMGRLTLEEKASEAAMRHARYEWLLAQGMDSIALGHHEDDLAETVLLQLIRGTGMDGFRGMRWRHEQKVRPLLAVSRAEILKYAQDTGLEWIEDPSNEDETFTRNRVRHSVLPLLERLRPGATQTIARSATLVSDEAAALEQLAIDWAKKYSQEVPLIALNAGPVALVRRGLRILRPTLTAGQIDAILDIAIRGYGHVQLDAGGYAKIRNDHLTLE